jgi:general secretion pathway protein K
MNGAHKASAATDPQANTRERGLALLVVLWIIVSAALIVSAFNAAVKSGVSFVGSEVQLAKADALLDAGAEIAVAHLIDEDEARRWVPDGKPRIVSFAGANLSIAIADGSSRIDLNKSDKELLMGLLRQFAGSEAAAGRLRDRILVARDKTPGAKNQSEARPGPNDGNRGERTVSETLPFLDVAQLRGLEGMTAELYAAIAPYLTVYSRDGRINPVAAPDAVLLSIPGIQQRDIERLRVVVGTRTNESDGALTDIAQRAGSYLADGAGPAYVVTVEVLRPDGKPGGSSVYVLATGIDKDAPYRLIAKKPADSGRLSGAS